ncbi:MAG: hypothetical protein JSU63_16410 [Phycisphaerales bacterium]|nr:MAG: hypothetical protein JSU63_16410 [Phycisphaerales bacterium]
MAQDRINQLRGMIMFVIAWLIGLYVFEVLQEASHEMIGFVAAVLTLGVNLYARKRAAACVEQNLAFKFWLFMPAVLFLALPVLVKVIIFFSSQGERSWWDHLVSLLPFILKLGVPVATLLWVYLALGRVESRADEVVSTT